MRGNRPEMPRTFVVSYWLKNFGYMHTDVTADDVRTAVAALVDPLAAKYGGDVDIVITGVRTKEKTA